MIVLDTNVISELVKSRRADARVVRWVRNLDEQPVTTVVNKAELLAGVALLPKGRRRTALAEALHLALDGLHVCLPFTEQVPAAYASIVAVRQASGRPVGASDAFIAAIASVHGAGVATRDVAGFDGVGLRVVSPWDA